MLDILIEATLRATLIGVTVPAALWLCRVRAPAVQHRALTIVVIAMLALPAWVAWAPEITLRVLPPAAMGTTSTIAGPKASVPAADSMTPIPGAYEQTAPGAGSSSAEGVAAASAAPAAGEGGGWRAWLLGLYLAGAGVLLSRLGIGTLRMRRLLREAQAVNGRLTSARIATPLTVGLLEPEVLLPAGWQDWPARRLAGVLEHEGTHVIRRDPLVQWLALFNRALFWFHPLAWWLERRLAALAEEICDAAVLARGHEPDAYSEDLLELARMARSGPVLPAIGTPMPGVALATRIAKILEGRASNPGSRVVGVSAVTLVTLAAAGLGSVTLAQEAASPPLVPSADSYTPLPEYWFSDDEWHLEVEPIMTPEEREAYESLRSLEERDRFIAAFWLRRDPTPGSLHNERRKEYERRIHYVEEVFGDPASSSRFGYQTTRGAVYVLLGKPDAIESVVEDGDDYEYWSYSDVNGTGQAFSVRLAAGFRIGCGPAYEIVEPEPTRTFQGAVSMGGPEPISARVYPFGLVTVSIPFQQGTVRHLRVGFEDGARAPGLEPAGFFQFTLPQERPPPDRPSPIGSNGLICTLPMPPGSYRLSAELDLYSGAQLTDSVAFTVEER